MPEVIDAWFDSGSMPFAQWGYPHVEGSKERFEAAFPADFICEAIDQTRGWFYTLMAVNTLVFDRSSYKNVLCLGHILAEDGRKMSKHLGNILEPLPLMDRARRRRRALVHGRLRLAVVGATRRAPGDRGDRPQGAADLLEHGRLPGALRPLGRLDAVGRGAGSRRADTGARPVGALGGAPAGPRRHRGAGGLRHPADRRRASRRTSTCCRTGTSGARGVASGPATPARWRRCTSACGW